MQSCAAPLTESFGANVTIGYSANKLFYLILSSRDLLLKIKIKDDISVRAENYTLFRKNMYVFRRIQESRTNLLSICRVNRVRERER